MSRPNTTFDSPPWRMVRDDHQRMYANVDNGMLCIDANGNITRTVPIVVPSELFTFMREVLNVETHEEVSLYLATDGDNCEYRVFGMTWGEEDSKVADLWAYKGQPDFLGA